jgi:hypothetical protein
VRQWGQANSSAIERNLIETAGRVVLLAAIACSWLLDWIVRGLGNVGMRGALAVIPIYNWMVAALYLAALTFLLFCGDEGWGKSASATEK